MADVITVEAGNMSGTVIGVTAFMLFLALSALSLRLYARQLRKAHLGFDDITMIAATLFTTALAIVIFIGAAPGGGIGKHEPVNQTQQLPVLTPQLKVLLQTSFASSLIGILSVGFTKISVILLYRRIFRSSDHSRWFSISTWSLIGIVSVWMISFFFATLFECHPIHANWDEYGGTPEQCVFEDPIYKGQAYVDVLTDLFILIVPIPSVWSLHMALKQKIAVTLMFLLGGVTLAISIVKTVAWYQAFGELENYQNDLTWIITPTILWVMIESAIGILGGCMPLMKPIFDDCVPVVRLTSYIRDLSTGGTSKGSRRGLFTSNDEEKQSLPQSKVTMASINSQSHESVQVSGGKTISNKASFT